MKLNKKIAIPLSLLALTIVIASWLYKSGRFSTESGYFKNDGHGHQEQAAAPLYSCPMHPFIIKDKPGTCPICGMDLVKKQNEIQKASTQTPEQKTLADMLGHVSVSPVQRVMANVATVEAGVQAVNKEISAVGTVQYDQSRQAKVTAWIAGRIDRLHVNAVGAYVSKDRPVAELYSPDLLSSQQEYLLAVKSRDRLKKSPIDSISLDGDGLVQSSRQRLMLFGVKERQIAELEKAGKPNIRLPIYTPLSGIVVEKLVQQGQYVNVGEVLFNIADLSRVWVELDVYENESSIIRVGQSVEIRSQSDPGRRHTGRVSFINPFMDPKTRTVKARVELANPGMVFKPDMFVNAVIRIALAKGIVVPVSAIIDTGKRQVVWVEASAGMFEPREVQVGQRTDDMVQILSGIRTGDKVAVSGAYLIDSESQLKSGTRDPGTGTGHERHTVPALPNKAAPVKKDRLNMDDMKM